MAFTCPAPASRKPLCGLSESLNLTFFLFYLRSLLLLWNQLCSLTHPKVDLCFKTPNIRFLRNSFCTNPRRSNFCVLVLVHRFQLALLIAMPLPIIRSVWVSVWSGFDSVTLTVNASQVLRSCCCHGSGICHILYWNLPPHSSGYRCLNIF